MADDLAAQIHALEALKAKAEEAEARFMDAVARSITRECVFNVLQSYYERRSETDFRAARWISENCPGVTREEMERLFERFAAGPQVVH